jgi:hypothetical protein
VGASCNSLLAEPKDLLQQVGPGDPANVFENGFGTTPPVIVPTVTLGFSAPVGALPQQISTVTYNLISGSPNTGYIVIPAWIFDQQLALNRGAFTGSLDLKIEPKVGDYDLIRISALNFTTPPLIIDGHATGTNSVYLMPQSLSSIGRLSKSSGHFELFVPLQIVNNYFSSSAQFIAMIHMSGTIAFTNGTSTLTIQEINQYGQRQHEWTILQQAF